MTKERRLGRGLAALLGEPMESSEQAAVDMQRVRIHRPDDDVSTSTSDGQSDDAIGGATDSRQILMLNVDDIEPNPFQPRREFGESELASMAESFKEHEQLQPILVRRQNDRWQIISGERRLRAAIHAGMKQIKACVREADDRLVAELAIVENLQRKDLNAIEKATSFHNYLRQHNCTQDDLGKRIKVDRSTIANLMRLLELPMMVQDMVRSNEISMGHARSLLSLGDPRLQIEFGKRIRDENWSVREAERQVAEHIQNEDSERLSISNAAKIRRQRNQQQNQQVAALETELRHALGTKVDIKKKARGTGGQIVLHFSSLDEFDRIREHLVGAKPLNT
ncbi:MAG: ParB/RepB/Spo0J family partition protein [Pirellulaceae bacterium]|nr:ParB/RepB/Spo0J family partition protein [Planctomycetales bacterium]